MPDDEEAANGEIKRLAQRSFRRAYRASASLTGGLISLSFFASLVDGGQQSLEAGGIGIAIILMILAPYLLKGGFAANLRVARIASAIMLLMTGLALGALCIEFSKTHGEGPNGEGAPGAFIIAMVFFATLFFSPWLLTSLRSISTRKDGKWIRP